MARIVRIEALMVDLKPKVKRTDAIQSFVSQETPIVRIYDADGAIGTGYSYTIGTGGPFMLSLSYRFVSLDSDDIVNIDKTKIGTPSIANCTSL